MADPLEPLERKLPTILEGVRILALRKLGDPEAAEEVAQETASRALEALQEGRLDDPGRLGSYVRGIAYHVIADRHRERGRRNELILERVETLGQPPQNPLQALLSSEQRLRVRAAVSELSDTDQEILRLSFWQGLSPSEIAERLDEPGPRVRKRKSRALQRLREILIESPEAEGHGEAGETTTPAGEGHGSFAGSDRGDPVD